MITYCHSGGAAELEQYVEFLHRDADIEETPEGLGYYVTDLPFNERVVGHALFSEGLVEVDLIVDGSFSYEERQQVSRASFASYAIVDALSVIRGYEEALAGLDAASLNGSHNALTRLTTTAMRQVVDRHQQLLLGRSGRLPKPVYALLGRQLRLAAAWLDTPDESEHNYLTLDQTIDSEVVKVAVYAAREPRNRHHCASCRDSIEQGSRRLTVVYPHEIKGYDHHHYHPRCILNKELTGHSKARVEAHGFNWQPTAH